eukprot:gnl/MRDRNA2_/MRDRNA2_74947_c0_seq1.p1 gnl/MRDRNA2_/MRDRNA2_74947_c0~~gnl/MRDRNA2_/MRDRNA2_74947_c0_seq1.p1  ORF type:complete len:525 (-),score=134.28 gnl/MRDRNA2_/MRDRNA2_74947_c0_seq1:44-1618(-)
MMSSGSQSARGPGERSKKLKAGQYSARANDFVTLVEHTTDAFVQSDDSAVEDVRKILSDVRQQYDRVNSDAEKKAATLAQLREAIRVADASSSTNLDDQHRLEEMKVQLEKKFEETVAEIDDAQTNRKVYQHMLSRTLHEQAVLKEKMLIMERYLGKKTLEVDSKVNENRKCHSAKVSAVIESDIVDIDAENERNVRESATAAMQNMLQSKRNAIKRRADFERWRHEVALEAASEAFQASAGRLRKLYAVEKLAGNCLQKITFEQVERSQATEDGFQKIREVTGLTDVMDIVHKFLNRDVEHEQLKSSVKEAEARLESLRQEFDCFKRDTDGITFDPDAANRSRTIYMEVDQHESSLQQALKDHEASRQRLQQTTIVVEHMKRWCHRISKSLAAFDEPARIEKPTDLVPYFNSLHRTIEKFVNHVATQISTGKVQRKTMSQAASKEYHEQARLLNDKDFLKSNCRVPASADGRPSSAKHTQGNEEEDLKQQLAADRDRHKTDCAARISREEELEKKKQKKFTPK